MNGILEKIRKLPLFHQPQNYLRQPRGSRQVCSASHLIIMLSTLFLVTINYLSILKIYIIKDYNVLIVYMYKKIMKSNQDLKEPSIFVTLYLRQPRQRQRAKIWLAETWAPVIKQIGHSRDAKIQIREIKNTDLWVKIQTTLYMLYKKGHVSVLYKETPLNIPVTHILNIQQVGHTYNFTRGYSI